MEYARLYENNEIITYLENQKKLEIDRKLAPIEQALNEFRLKVTDINWSHYAKAYKEANKLLQKLESSREKYRDSLYKEEFNANMEKAFKAECVAAIKIARPILEKDLDWGVYIQNLLKAFVNTVSTSVGGPSFFKPIESESLKAVKKAAINITLNDDEFTAALGA